MHVVNVEAAIVDGDRYLMIIRGEAEAHAAGTLRFPGGQVEQEGEVNDILETTLRREIVEEVGVTVAAEMKYVESKAFMTGAGEAVIDLVFLCYYTSGAPVITDPGEVADIQWLTATEILAHAKTPPCAAFLNLSKHTPVAEQVQLPARAPVCGTETQRPYFYLH